MADRVRSAVPADAGEVAVVHVAGWRSGYRGLVREDYLDALSVAERELRWRGALEQDVGLLVHDRDGRVQGFCAFGRCRDDDVVDAAGEVYSLYVLPAAWGGGVGAGLLAAAVEVLRAEDGAGGPLVLWALEGNLRARRFYEDRGWQVDGRRRVEHRPGAGDVAGISFAEVRYRGPR